MIYLRAAILTTFAIVCAVFTFVFFSFDADYQLENALETFQRGEYGEAMDALSVLEGEVSPSQLALYQAYVRRAEGDLAKSNEHLDLAEQGAQRQANTEGLLEIYLNRALNAYMAMDDKTFAEQLKRAQHLAPQDPFTVFFEGLDLYLEDDFARAEFLWVNLPKLKAFSPWMEKGFEKVLKPSWLAIRLAHCNIEQGKFLAGRQFLDIKNGQLSLEEQTEVAFLTGLSYAKEAEDKPWVAAMPYYQLAQSYFDQVPIHHEEFLREKVRITRHLKEAALFFIKNRNLEHMTFFVNILENWSSEDELDEISNTLISLLDNEVAAGNWEEVEELASVINRVLRPGKLRDSLGISYELTMASLLEKGELEMMLYFWKIALLLSDEPVRLRQGMSTDLAKRTLSALENDTEELELVTPLLNFWSVVESDGKKRFLFAKQLVLISGDTWIAKSNEPKAFAIMKLAETLPYLTEKKLIQQGIEQQLRQVYAMASKEDDIDKLSTVYDAARHFHISDFGREEESEIASQIEDANYLIKIGRFLEAEKRLEWILKVSEDHPQAKRLLGIALYKQEKFTGALAVLANLAKKDKDIDEMLAICRIVEGEVDRGRRVLEHLAKQHPLTDLAYTQLAHLSLLDGDEDAAWKSLKRIRRHTGETLAYMSIAAYQKREWEIALDYFHQLPTPYSKSRPLKILVLRSFTALKNSALAEQTLIQILSEGDVDAELLSKRFVAISNKALEHPDLNILAGEFYKDFGDNDPKALEYFNLVKIESPRVRLNIAELHLRLGNVDTARQLFLEIARQEEDKEARGHAMLFLVDIYETEHRSEEVLSWYKEYYSFYEKETHHRVSYVNTLASMMQWKPAIEQMVSLRALRELSADEEILYIKLLVFSANAREAIEHFEKVFTRGEGLSTLNRIKVMRLMHIAGNQGAMKSLWTDLIAVDEMKILEKQELAALYIDLGYYSKAEDALKVIRDEVSGSIAGLKVLARLSAKSGRPDQALAYARKAFALNPYDFEILDLLHNYEHDLASLKTLEMTYTQVLEKDKDHLLAQLGLAHIQMIAIQEREAQRILAPQDASNAFSTVHKKLRVLTDHYHTFPEVFLLLGRSLRGMNKLEDAEQALGLAIKQNPSMLPALRELADLSEVLGFESKALALWEQSLQYERDHAQSWLRVGALHLVMKNFEMARSSLEQAERLIVVDSEQAENLRLIIRQLAMQENAAEDIEGTIADPSADIQRNLRALMQQL